MLYAFTSLRRTGAPAASAVLLADAKAHLRVTGTAEDSLLEAYIAAAVLHVEEVSGRALVDQEWTMTLDAFPAGNGPIVIPRPPLTAITSITYVDSDGATQTLSAGDYLVDDASEPGAVTPAYDVSWPVTRTQRGAVTVVFTAGVEAPEDESAPLIPEPIRQAILLLVGHFYENREAISAAALTVVPMAVDALLAPYRMVQI